MINQKKSVRQVIDSIKLFHNGIFISRILVTIVFVSFGFASDVHADTPSLLLPSQTEEMLQQNANYARLSEDIYNIDPEKPQTRKKGFELLDYEDNLGNGFTAGTYRNTSTGEITIVYGGTTAGKNDINDIIADIALLTNGDVEPPQQREARRYAADILAEYPQSDITISGHSLGGSLAQYISMNTGLKAVTFNSGPVPFYGVNSNSDSSNILNIRTLDDPLSILLTLAVKLESGELSQENIAANIDLLKDAISACNSPQCLAVRIGIDWDEFFNGDDAIAERISSRRLTILRVLKDNFGLPYDTPLSSMFRGENHFLSLKGGGHSMDYILTEAIRQENIYNFLNPPLQYNYDEFPEIIAQTEVIEEPVFLSAPDDPSNIPEALVATAPDITDDIIADLVEEADPDDPVTPDPVLVGVFSGVNGTPSSNLAIQGVLSNVVETSTGNASFEITGDCVSGCTVTGTSPEPEASSYSHLSWGRLSQTVRMTDTSTGITHDIQQMRWLYGDATSSDYLNTRTGIASYAGQIYGDATEVGVTQYNTITGGIGLSFNFSDDSLSGQAYFSQGGVPQEGFNIAGGLTSSGGQQYLQGSLTSQNSASTNTGGLLGAFYGPEASELGGAIWVLSDEFAVGGVFVASSDQTFVMPDIYYGDTHTRITANKIGFGVYGSDNFDGNGDTVNIQPSLGGGSVTKTETFAASGYSYSSWGKWTADAGNINPDYAQGGYWSETQTTPASVVQNRTGTASYSGNIVGDFVSNAGVRDDARGLININADFSNQSVSGQMQFGHDCGGGSGPSGCNVVSGVASFNEAINDYGGSGFGSHSNTVNTTGSGVVGIFAGPNAEEIAGTAWMNDNDGLYNGVFIAGQ